MISLKGVKPGTLEYRRLWHKRRRMVRRKLGRCLQCNAKCESDRTRCDKCREIASREASQRVYHRHQIGLCTRCRKPMDRNGWTCVDCTEKCRIANRETREQRRLNHECFNCGKPLDLTEKEKLSGKGFACERCLEKRRAHERRRK